MERKILLKNIAVPGIRTFEVFRSTGGYRSVEKALKTMSPDEVVEEVKKSGLRGRGGAGFPAGMKWNFIDKKSDKPRYLICNADESEPGTFKDRYLMEKIPHLLIEGMICSCYALGPRPDTSMSENTNTSWNFNEAIREAYANGFLGNNILGSSYSLDIHVHSGAGAYICGEETAMIESLEGKRGNPRIKPPFPAVVGLYGGPTVVNNVETLANIGFIVNHGGTEYARYGSGKSTGTKLISACGNINNPGVYEIEMGLSVREFLFDPQYCGGIKNNKKLKAVIAGGSSVPILPAKLILQTASGEERLFTYESLADGGFVSGTMLGSGGFIVYGEDACIVRNTWNLARFYHHESCGQCSPCREGTGWMENVLHRIENGLGRTKDIDLLVSIAAKIEGNTICPLGDAAAWPVASAIRHFRHEFEEHVLHPERCSHGH